MAVIQEKFMQMDQVFKEIVANELQPDSVNR
jgi:hypothetical protein